MTKAIAYFCNGLGNFVMMMPAIQALRDMTKQPVDVVIPSEWRDSRRPAIEAICAAWDVVGDVIDNPKEPVDAAKYAHWFWSAHNENREALGMFKARMRHAPVAKPDWRGTMIHERDHYIAIARAMGWRNGAGLPTVHFPVADSPQIEKTGNRPVIGFCNGAFETPMWAKKHWPNFTPLAELMRRYFHATIVGVGGPNELKGVPLDHDFTGKLSITESARVIGQCDLFVSTDTGCMHIADIMGVPTIALFGSTLTSKNGPLNSRSCALIADVECAPCQNTGRFFSCQNYICMERITIGDVMHVARRICK